MKPVFITGYGLTCALGNSSSEVRRAIQSGQSGIAPIEGIANLNKQYLGGQVKQANSQLLDKLNLSKPIEHESRTAILAMSALHDLLETSTFESDHRCAFINASSVGGMDTSEIEYLSDKPDHSKYQYHSIGGCTEAICTAFGWNILRDTISTACSSAANAIMLAGRLIASGKYDQVIAGGSDALSLFTIRGFDGLMIYDSRPCSPFDKNRKGLNLGEGAAYVMLESEQSFKRSGNSPLTELKGWANTNDAFHATASSPDGKGAQLAMQGAIKRAGLKTADIGYINAHGTATPNNDLSEATAIKSVFDVIPPFSSTKALTGHTLAAAGSIEAVFSCMALEHSTIWPNLNFKTPIDDLGLEPVVSMTNGVDMKHVLSNSFGFGGNNTSLVISAI